MPEQIDFHIGGGPLDLQPCGYPGCPLLSLQSRVANIDVPPKAGGGFKCPESECLRSKSQGS
jgi:hypothetical protein